jgi:hypothetical protein
MPPTINSSVSITNTQGELIRNTIAPARIFVTGALLALFIAGCGENDSPAPAGPGPFAALAKEADIGPASSGSIEVRLHASAADPLASGHATWERRPDRVKFSVEVEDVATSGPHEVRINRRTVGCCGIGTSGMGKACNFPVRVTSYDL